VWYYALTKGQTEQLEAIQKRTIHIILNFSRGMPYILMLTAANLTTLASRREEISKKMFCILLNQLHACTTSSQNQENPRSFLGLEPIRNILEFTLEPNVTAPLSTMR